MKGQSQFVSRVSRPARLENCHSKVVDALSSHDVLTLTFEAGDRIGDEALEQYEGETNAAGRRLFHAMGREIFELCRTRRSSPGEFCLRSDGSVVMYDFGCIKKLDPHVVDHYRRIVTLAEGDYEALDQHLIKLGGALPAALR